MRKIIVLLWMIFLLLNHSQVFAWSGAGHMVIAAEAYRELSPDLKKRVTEILKAHPEYAKWKESYERYGNGIGFDTFILMRSATWPDEIRRGHGLRKNMITRIGITSTIR